jgi:hypothetical protein
MRTGFFWLGDAAMSNATEFASDVFAWFKQIHTDQAIIPNAKPISASDFRLAYVITQYINRYSRKAWPLQSTLADDLGVDVRTVGRGIANLVKRGHMSVTLQGRDQPAIYQMIIQDRTPMSDHDELRPDTHVRSKPQDRTSVSLRPDICVPKTGHPCPTEHLSEPLREPSREDSPRPQFDLEEDRRREVDTISVPETTDDGFPEFYATYPRRVARAAAKKAYRGALKKGATPAELLAGAMRAAAAYQIDAQRRGAETAYEYVAYPASWLNKERWEDEPAPSGGAYSAPSGRPDPIAVAEQIARQLMEKDGGHVIQ